MPRNRDQLSRIFGAPKRNKRRNLEAVNQDVAALSQVSGRDPDGDKTGGPFAFDGCVVITVPASSVGSDMTGFVVACDLSLFPADFWLGVDTDGQDVTVSTAGGTRIPAHVFNFDYGNETGWLLFRAPSLSSSVDNVFRACFGTTAANFVGAADIDLTSEITNPGAETGDVTGWTSDAGTLVATASLSGGSGSYRFQATALNTRYYQDVSIPAAYNDEIDSGDWIFTVGWVQDPGGSDYGMVGMEFLDGSSTPLDDEWKSAGRGGSSTGSPRSFSLIPPSGTRKVRIWMESRGNVGGVYAGFDDFTLKLENVDVMKRWGVWQDYIGVCLFEDLDPINYGPGDPHCHFNYGGTSPAVDPLDMGLGAGVAFGSSGFMQGAFGAPLPTGTFTMGATIKPAVVGSDAAAVGGFTKRTSATEAADERAQLYHDSAGDLRIFDDHNGVLSSGETLVNGTEYRVHMRYQAASERSVFLDGVEVANETPITAPAAQFMNVDIGVTHQGGNTFHGSMAFFYFRRDGLSDDWITAEHLMLSDQATFFSVASAGDEGSYLRHDGEKWQSVQVAAIRDDLQADYPFAELGVANEFSAEQTYDDGSTNPAAFATYTLQTTSPTTEDYPDGTLWVKTTATVELWVRSAGSWVQIV